MDDTTYIVAFIVVATLATFATRAIPFLFLGRHHEHPLLLHVGRYLPAAVMALLVVVFLARSGTWAAPAFGADALIPSVLVVALHLWRRNALLSIVAGTVVYMAIQQTQLVNL
ncbi:Branched-chain amino acid transport protein AzlD [Marinobacter daqiaonensis]|uniref:Branched-chain amino acid transport protein AzlD n=1 Tax=Marinobacter daqiaonensis TaxID=650891 RepID=A0A1I6GN65_9GAMM|nr:AzlD domain-containing protein [Marinobacter daqiaonensis]SFR43672.1 Branched-chain amino acid transport protein AzlD [Marinobacter daqiaonensis]